MLLSALVLSAVLSPGPPGRRSGDERRDARRLCGRRAQAAIDAGLAAFKKRRFAQAEGTSRRRWMRTPASAAPYFYLAYTYYKQAEPKRPFHPDKQKAKDMFAKAYAIDPAFRPVWGEVGGPRGSDSGSGGARGRRAGRFLQERLRRPSGSTPG